MDFFYHITQHTQVDNDIMIIHCGVLESVMCTRLTVESPI